MRENEGGMREKRDRTTRFIDAAIERGWTDNYDRAWLVRCDTCQHDWHGLRCDWSHCHCPGEIAKERDRDERRCYRIG